MQIMEQWMGKAFVVGVLLIVLAAGRDAWAALPRSTAMPPKPAYEVGVSVYFDAWAARWQARLAAAGRPAEEVRAQMDRVNPLFVPRNHLVEAVITAAVEDGDFGPFETLNRLLAHPYDDQPKYARYAELPPSMEGYRTFCGT